MSTPREALEADVVHALLNGLRQVWLSGYAATMKRWEQDAPLQGVATRRLEQFHAVFRSGVPTRVSQDALQVQMVNLVPKDADALQWLASLPDIAPPASVGWFRRIWEGKAPPVLPEDEGWRRVRTGMQSPSWDMAAAVWSALIPAFRSLVEVVLSDDPPPQTMSTAADLAWLDRVAARPLLGDEEKLKVLQALPREEAAALAEMLIEQHHQWRERDIPFFSTGHASISYFIPNVLANLACFNGPLPLAVHAMARMAGIEYPPLIFRTEESLADAEADGDSGMHTEYSRLLVQSTFEQGVTLEETDEPPPSPAVFAPAAQFVTTEESGDLMLVLLDIDLAQPEVAFLGLHGTRLVICGEVEPSGEPFMTRVTLDGKAAIYPGEPERLVPTTGPTPSLPAKSMVNGRALMSPFEGLREAGYLGSRDRLGGVPAWEQDAEVPVSPASGERMKVLGQRPYPDGGTAYVFMDVPNLICAVVQQYD